MQESRKYKEIVRQHVDLETMQTRVEQGLYSSCHLNFYRDVLLLFNNAIVFFPKSSLESATAHELRRLVSVEVDKETRTHNPDSSQEPQPPKPQLQRCDSLLDKQKSTAPIVVCRKRSSVSAKPSSTFAQKPDPSDDDKKKAPSIGLLKLKTQEKAIITGTRSSRRNTNNKNPTNNSTPPSPPPSNNKKQSSGSASVDKQEVWKRDNKKKTDKKKSVVDFLKRIKKNSPVQSAKKGSEGPKRSNNSNTSGKKEKEERQSSGSGEKKQRTSSPKKNVGRPPKKAADTTPVTGKRAREVVVAKRQTKRARR